MMKILHISIIFLLCFGIVKGYSEQSQVEAANSVSPNIQFERKAYDYGTVYQGEKIPCVYRFKNAGTGNLIIEKVRSGCSCAAAIISSKKLLPGETGEIKVIFYTKGRQGKQSKTIYVHSNDPDEPIIKLKITGLIKTTVTTNPRTLSFGTVSKGETATKNARLILGEKVKVLKAESSSDYLTLELSKLKDEDNILELKVILSPETPVGQLREKITIHTNVKKQPFMDIPVQASVSGEIDVSSYRIVLRAVKQENSYTPEYHGIRIRSLSGEPFEITKVECDSEFICVELYPIQKSARYYLTASIRKDAPVGTIKGNINIHTDNPEQKRIMLTFVAIIAPKQN